MDKSAFTYIVSDVVMRGCHSHNFLSDPIDRDKVHNVPNDVKMPRCCVDVQHEPFLDQSFRNVEEQGSSVVHHSAREEGLFHLHRNQF